MPQIGIYSVDSTELTKSPSEREYEQKGLYDTNNQVWSKSTDSRIRCILPDENERQYSLEEIQEKIETSTVHVYREDEVPGTVTKPSVNPDRFYVASD